MKKRLAGLLFTVAVLGAATLSPSAASASADPAPPPGGGLVSSTGRPVAHPEAAAGPLLAFDPNGAEERAAGDGVAPAVPEGATSPTEAATESVIGPDGRTQVSATTSYPSSAIGQINFDQGAGSFICSGWLIDPNTVMTSGHCVHEGAGGTWSTNVRFTPGRNGTGAGSAPYGTCRDTELLTTGNWISSSSAVDDWGIIQLNCNVGTQTGWFGAKNDTDANLQGSAITLRGYPGDQASGTMWTMDDQVRALNANQLFYQADSAGGQSGSPVYQPNGCSGPCGVAVHSYGPSGSTPPASTNNYGPRLTTTRLNDISSVAGANNAVPTPTNDVFADAAAMTGNTGTLGGTTVGATKQLGEPRHDNQPGGASGWYQWTAPMAGTLTVDTFNSAFDTLLAAYTGTAVNALTGVASNDDADNGSQSRIQFAVTSGTTYRIAVDGYDGANGATTLHWSFVESVKPTITLNSPPPGATYQRGQVVNALYSCADNAGGSGIASCTGTVASGSPINTSTLGQHTFTVNATDGAGNTEQVSRTYTVIDVTKPTITLTTPAADATYTQNQVVNAQYTCADDAGGSGMASCTGTVANGSPINTSTLGQQTFTVNAADNAGNTQQVSRTYTVVAGDTTGPTITVTSPVQGAVVEKGAVVLADFACTDPSGVTSCTGTVADGARVNTTALGLRTFTVNATDTKGNTSTRSVTYRVVRHRADAQVRRGSDRAFLGDNVVNTTGFNQSRATGIPRGASATFYVKIQNDGSVADTFGVRARGANRNFTVRWFQGQTDVTSQLLAGTFRTASLNAGGTAVLRAVITAKPNAVRNSVVTSTVTVTSVGRPAAVDVVKVAANRTT
jgi:glutamyl endopeptidase